MGGIEYWILKKRNSTKLKLFFLKFILEPKHLPIKKKVGFVLKSPKPWGPKLKSWFHWKALDVEVAPRQCHNAKNLQCTQVIEIWVFFCHWIQFLIKIWISRGIGGVLLIASMSMGAPKWFHTFQTYGMGITTFWVLFVTGNLIKVTNQLIKKLYFMVQQHIYFANIYYNMCSMAWGRH